MPDKAIVCFLDILGYETIVDRLIKDAEFIKDFDELMHDLTVGLLERSRRVDLPNQPVGAEYLRKVLNTIKVRCIYDSIIFSLPLSGIEFDSQEFDKEKTAFNCIDTLFNFMATFSVYFISLTGLVLRGGISAGSHHESERDNYLFIFSEAHNKAVRLEEEANYPRILLDDSLRKYFVKLSYPHVPAYFYIDEDGRYCFDSYNILYGLEKQLTRTKLNEIKVGIMGNIQHNSNNDNIMKKLRYFTKYHNQKVGKNQLNFPDLTIDSGGA